MFTYQLYSVASVIKCNVNCLNGMPTECTHRQCTLKLQRSDALYSSAIITRNWIVYYLL